MRDLPTHELVVDRQDLREMRMPPQRFREGG